MDFVEDYHALIVRIIHDSGMNDRELNTHVGLAIYFVVQLAMGTRRSSLVALATVAVAEGATEVIDRLHAGSWQWPDTSGDIGATLFWPLMFVLVSQIRRRRWDRKLRRAADVRALIDATTA